MKAAWICAKLSRSLINNYMSSTISVELCRRQLHPFVIPLLRNVSLCPPSIENSLDALGNDSPVKRISTKRKRLRIESDSEDEGSREW